AHEAGGPAATLRHAVPSGCEARAEAGVGAAVEIPVDSQRDRTVPDAGPIRVRLLGRLAVERNGAAVTLPASRKARTLLAWLALAPRAVGRETLCDLLWDA